MAGFGAHFSCSQFATCSAVCKGSGCVESVFAGKGTWEITNSTDETAQHPMIDFSAMHNDQGCKENQTFDEENQYKDQAAIVDAGGGSVCCKGDASCRNVGSIIINENNIHPLICSGHRSCQDVNTIEANTADIVCSGYFGCKGATMESMGNMYCSGSYSCSESTITAKGDVNYCGGEGGCHNANISIPTAHNSSILLL